MKCVATIRLDVVAAKGLHLTGWPALFSKLLAYSLFHPTMASAALAKITQDIRAMHIDSAVVNLPSGSKVYCEADGINVWKLLSSFEQPDGKRMGELSQQTYDTYFCNGSRIWIHGNSEGLPLLPLPRNDGNFHVLSHDWRAFLAVGKKYKLRQQVFKTVSKNQIFDVSFTFTFNGVTMQDQVTDHVKYSTDRAWTLTDREVIRDETGATWDIKRNETVRFFPPFSPAAEGPKYFGHDGFCFEDWENKTFYEWRTYGAAGIIGDSRDNNDPALAWAPYLGDISDEHVFDIAILHQAGGSAYGWTGGAKGPAFLTYWIAEVEEDEHNDASDSPILLIPMEK